MLVAEYIKRKNDIVFAKTGIILVPEDQVEEVKQFPLSMDSDARACPYCLAFYFQDTLCEGCPMDKANNNCEASFHTKSTYEKVKGVLHGEQIVNTYGIKDELFDLIYQYNKELEDGK
jgi:hypothetical protein